MHEIWWNVLYVTQRVHSSTLAADEGDKLDADAMLDFRLDCWDLADTMSKSPSPENGVALSPTLFFL
jgi:hypothetical protein